MTDDSSMIREQTTSTGMHIVDLKPLLATAPTINDVLQQTAGLWTTICEEMTDDETLWVFAPNKYDDSGCWPVSMALADYARDESGLTLKNTITRHTELSSGGDMQNGYEEILFFVKDKRSYRFNKDSIRVAHVYEGKEWGGERETGSSAYHDTEVRRYNPNGKDPGNVWLDERRDQSADETIDETRPLPRVEALKRCIRAGSLEDETVHLWMGSDTSFQDAVISEDRDLNKRSHESNSYR